MMEMIPQVVTQIIMDNVGFCNDPLRAKQFLLLVRKLKECGKAIIMHVR